MSVKGSWSRVKKGLNYRKHYDNIDWSKKETNIKSKTDSSPKKHK